MHCDFTALPKVFQSGRMTIKYILNATDLTISHISVLPIVVVVVVLLFYVHGKHLRSCRDGQLT